MPGVSRGHYKALKNRPDNVTTFLDEARQWAQSEYAAALFKGSRLPAAEKAAVAKKLSSFTGLSEEYLIRANLRVTLGQFNAELLRSRGLTAGRIDARFTGYTFDLLTENAQGDPEGPAVGGAFTALVNMYNHDELKIGQDRQYKNTSGGGAWNWVRRQAGGRRRLSQRAEFTGRSRAGDDHEPEAAGGSRERPLRHGDAVHADRVHVLASGRSTPSCKRTSR